MKAESDGPRCGLVTLASAWPGILPSVNDGSDLDALLRSLSPRLAEGEFVFVDAPGNEIPAEALAMVREPEGVSLVITKEVAVERGLHYDYVAAWITLQVPSDLAAVGLTSAVSAALARRGISCNVIAGRRHDHLLVNFDRRHEAIEALEGLSRDQPPRNDH